MKNNKVHFSHVREVELRLILGLLLIALLNVIIYRSLAIGQPHFLIIFNNVGILIYGICLTLMLLFTLIQHRKFLSYTFHLILGVMVINIVFNLINLIVNHRIADNGTVIVADASLIWLSSLGVFSFWYWIVDRGGPIERSLETHNIRRDLLFPQYQTTVPGWENWKPNFWDYFVFSFFTSTGFSPADTLPLSQRVKLLMMIEATVSLVIIGMVISRALSLIQ